MKIRFIRPEEGQRFMVRGPFTEDTLNLSHVLIDMGYVPVGFVKFWIHVFFWRRKSRKAKKD
tara:strand:- start:24526 stop:24711 length:186 start_codon:yes stop_codon:yes gene_type:complete